jgi:hypothetical protein
MNAGAPVPPTNLVLRNLVYIRANDFAYAAEFMPGVAVTIVLAVGCIYLFLMIRTLRSGSLHVDAGV